MPYVVQTTPDPAKAHLREQHMKAHGAFLAEQKGIILAAGAMLEESGANTGGLMLLDVPDRAAAEQFIANDPFARAGVFAAVTIRKLRLGYFNFAKAG
jgi:uncharacterized protein YciI